MSLHLFAGVRVRDFQAARPWYEQLLGEPSFFPHATEAVWTLAEDRSVYVVEHADGAGKSVATIFLDDLDGQVAAIAARGLEPDERETLSNGVRKAIYRDSDGNELVFGGAPLDTGLQPCVRPGTTHRLSHWRRLEGAAPRLVFAVMSGERRLILLGAVGVALILAAGVSDFFTGGFWERRARQRARRRPVAARSDPGRHHAGDPAGLRGA
ncbi:MAG TPA: VOC family protein [Solirubrobacteraceae bacterium]|jgi:hypothetical protein|nr:VOC family protein [Solirubrobacteraceae bacterium]